MASLIVQVGNTTLPHVAGFIPTHEKIVEFERDSEGNGHGDLITKKWKLQITFSVLTAEETASVLNATSNFSFPVTFYNTETGSTTTVTCYEGNKNFPLWKVDQSGGYMTNGGTLNLIEL